MGSHSITDSHISTITDTILLLQYVEIKDSFSNFEQIFSGAPHRIVPDQNVQNVFKGLDNN